MVQWDPFHVESGSCENAMEQASSGLDAFILQRRISLLIEYISLQQTDSTDPIASLDSRWRPTPGRGSRAKKPKINHASRVRVEGRAEWPIFNLISRLLSLGWLSCVIYNMGSYANTPHDSLYHYISSTFASSPVRRINYIREISVQF